MLAAADPDSQLRQNPMSPLPRETDELRVPAALFIAAVWTATFLYGAATGNWLAWSVATPLVVLAANAIFNLRGRDDEDE